jgi:hypothetical protein
MNNFFIKGSLVLTLLASCASNLPREVAQDANVQTTPTANLCPDISFDSDNKNEAYIAGIVCEVMHDSYQDLLKIKIEVKAIEDSKMLNKFSNGKLSFISFFNEKRFIPFANNGYIIGYSKVKLFNQNQSGPQLTHENLKAVLSHELSHTVLWKKISPLGDVGYAAYTTVGSADVRAKYERQIDIDAIERGIQSGHLYSRDLGGYRSINEMRTEQSKRAYLRQVYYFGEQLQMIEDAGLKYSGKTRDKFFNKLRKNAPVQIKELSKFITDFDQNLE